MNTPGTGTTPRHDELYDTLFRMHLGLNDEQSVQVNARLILLLANHIGDPLVIREAARMARAGLQPGG